MSNFILIALCIALGMFFRSRGTLPQDAHKGINAWLINIGLPAISFKYLPHIELTSNLLVPAVAPILLWLFGWLYIALYARYKGLDKPTTGALKLTASLSNTSFVGFPLIMAYFSEQEIGIGIICDQVTFLLLLTVGILVALRSSNHHSISARLLLRKLLTFPPIWGCIMALTLGRKLDITSIQPVIQSIAATVAPLALFSIGLQLRFKGWLAQVKTISVALLYKLILGPAILALTVLLLGIKGITTQIAIFEAAMPTLLTSGIIADQYGLNPKLANLIIGISIMVSLLTTAIWYCVLHLSGWFS